MNTMKNANDVTTLQDMASRHDHFLQGDSAHSDKRAINPARLDSTIFRARIG